MSPETASITVRQLAARHGFELCRITRPQIDPMHVEALNRWLAGGMHGDMDWMTGEERLARHSDPAALLDGVQSVISVGMRYSPPAYSLDEAKQATDCGVISAYAHGDDYHEVMKRRLKALARDLDGLLGTHQQRVYVDTAPLLEHALADRAGLGWQGKHSLTLNRDMGSWFLLGELFTTARLEADHPASFHCGTCTACIDICPTQAIVAPFVVDARRCISYLTIEHKGHIPRHLRAAMGNRIYGCDDCQMACPWNREIPSLTADFLAPRGENCLPGLAILLGMDEADFRARFAKSPIRRTGRERLLRNCCVAAGNSGKAVLMPPLRVLTRDPSAMLRLHAVWALGRLCGADDASRVLQELHESKACEQDAEVREELDLTIRDIKERL